MGTPRRAYAARHPRQAVEPCLPPIGLLPGQSHHRIAALHPGQCVCHAIRRIVLPSGLPDLPLLVLHLLLGPYVVARLLACRLQPSLSSLLIRGALLWSDGAKDPMVGANVFVTLCFGNSTSDAAQVVQRTSWTLLVQLSYTWC